MKWLPFLLIIVFSCKSRLTVKQAELKKIPEEAISYNDSVRMPSTSSPWEDSGYFKGYIPVTIDSLEKNDTTLLTGFLSSIINKKDIVLLTNETLSHSVFIDQGKKSRMDTLKNKEVTIISKYTFGEAEAQHITMNGVVIKDYKWKGEDRQEDVFDIDEYSFRHFSFKGKEYYYMQAGAFYVSGASMGNVTYHLIYSVDHKRLSYFTTCRFNKMLFGDVNGDNDLDYLDFDNSDFCTTVPYSDNAIIQLYSCDKKGNFVLQKDVKGKPFFIEGRTGDWFAQDSFNVKKSYWPVTLK